MAGDWIKMREDLFEDPAVLRIAEKLKTRPEHVVGYCHRFWGWVSRNCPDGVLEGVTLDAIEDVIRLPNFLKMLCEVGWLEYVETPKGAIITIPKFERHLSQGAKRRVLEAEKKRLQRAGKAVPFVSPKCPENVPPREEKRREEFKEDLTTLDLLAKYHEIGGVKKVRKLTKERQDKLHRRQWRNPEWIKVFLEALDKLPIPGDGWQPDFDWLIANESNVYKILEGKYDWRAERDSKPDKPIPTRISE